MSLDTDDEILQDFLVEAGEILEQLNEQLVDLEQRPDDYDLLNAVFRGFHTIKGGAGFLNIHPLVEVTHRAEDVFNVLRQGQRNITPELMDSVMEVLDVVNTMFALIPQGEMPEHASPELIQALTQLARPEAEDTPATEQAPVEPAAVDAPQPASPDEASLESAASAPAAEMIGEMMDAANEAASPAAGSDEITEEEFEALLDQLHGEGKFSAADASAAPAAPGPAAKPVAADSDDISEDEFEALLDELHGQGQFKADAVGAVPAAAKPVAARPPAGDSDEISEDEFEALLDELHGKGQFGAGVDAAPASNESGQPVPAKPPGSTAEAPKPEPAKPTAAKAEPATEKPAESPARPKAPLKPPPAAPAKSAPAAAETTVRVDTSRLDEIMNMVGELVLVRNRLQTLKASIQDEDMIQAVANLDVVTSDLQLSVMKTRMQPIKKVFGRFPRVVRDLARSLKKEVDLTLVGEDTDLDKNLVEALADPLVHLVRNAVDHGVEIPEEREKAGKPRKGAVVLSAAQEGDHIILSIRDDGKGMNADVLRRKAVEKGMMDEESASRMEDKDCFNLIFAPGFSTKTEISDVSGRGVGMDVVKTRIAQMNGQVEIDSVEGQGSLITIKLPLTLAILPTLMVVLGEQPFALPLSSVVEIFNLDLSHRNVVDGRQTIMVRNRALPLFFLRQWLVRNAVFDIDEYANGHGHVVVVNMGGVQVGLVVDHLVGQEEVVIKPLGKMLQGIDGLAGATITGDGKIALILDVPGLMRKYAHRF